ncbi:hypothetical protein [Geobacter sp. FeAm09]|uniref:hypothetical protein n=1 Tax=Geobacter sp. FeAm09 TaxID=2597769 RepID=UPI00143D83E1|nr:hypothetical protein [Geobacter sp. FeAm09]
MKISFEFKQPDSGAEARLSRVIGIIRRDLEKQEKRAEPDPEARETANAAA